MIDRSTRFLAVPGFFKPYLALTRWPIEGHLNKFEFHKLPRNDQKVKGCLSRVVHTSAKDPEVPQETQKAQKGPKYTQNLPFSVNNEHQTLQSPNPKITPKTHLSHSHTRLAQLTFFAAISSNPNRSTKNQKSPKP